MRWREHLAAARSYGRARVTYMRERGWSEEDWYARVPWVEVEEVARERLAASEIVTSPVDKRPARPQGGGMTKTERAVLQLREMGARRGDFPDPRDDGRVKRGWWYDGVFLGTDARVAIASVRG